MTNDRRDSADETTGGEPRRPRRSLREWFAVALVAVAAMLAAAGVGSWFRAFDVKVNTVVLAPDGSRYLSPVREAGTDRGRLWLEYTRAERVEAWARHPRRLDVSCRWRPASEDARAYRDAPPWLARLGVTWRTDGYSYNDPRYGAYESRQFALTFPYWPLVGVIGGLGWWIGRKPRVMRRRRSRGLCAACGYDLRGTRDRCPECGAVAERLVKAAS